MGYNELSYLLVFLPITVLLYSVCPGKAKKYALAGASWAYFWLCSRHLIAYLLATTSFIYLMGLWIGKVGSSIPDNYEVLLRKAKKAGEITPELSGMRRKKALHRALMLFSLVLLFGVLLYLKYTGFFLSIAGRFAGRGEENMIAAPALPVPVGLSFYTLEAVGYILEVYWKRIPAEHDFFGIALLIGFFPQTMEGPIARYGDTVPQFTGREKLFERTGEDMAFSCMRIFWGMFKKIVIADRLNTVVSSLFDGNDLPHGVMIIVAAVCYTVQLYMEFSGMMDVVCGSARLVGIKLPENFRQPFFSQSASEFWRRWHITLGAWLKDYVFYPVAASKTSKETGKKVRKKHGRHAAKLATSALALTPVWLFNGLWHGPQLNYIFYGIYYLVLLLLEQVIDPARDMFYEKTGIDRSGKGATLFRILRTWVIIFTGELFFRASGLRMGIRMFRNLFHGFGISQLWNGSLLRLGIDRADWMAVVFGTAVVFFYDLLAERGFSIRDFMKSRKTPVRWACFYILIFAVILFGAYGTGYTAVDLIYAGF